MKVLVFDTETNGLIPRNKNIVSENLHLMPYIVQLSYILFDTVSKKIVVERDFIIRLPEEVEISKESSNIHGITKEISNSNGITMYEALEDFDMQLSKTDIVIAHNITFDTNMIAIESLRNNMEVRRQFTRKINYCTMKRTVELCKITAVNRQNKEYFKYPTLTQLHEFLFNETPLGTHNSMADVFICLRCYFKVKFEEDLCSFTGFKRSFYNICK